MFSQLRDLNGNITNNGTIEDTLGKKFIESQFKSFYNSKLEKDCSLELKEERPFIEQIKIFLQQNKHDPDGILDAFFKKKISDNFNPSNTARELSTSQYLVEKYRKIR